MTSDDGLRPLIQADRLTYGYTSDEVLKEVSVDVRAGEIVAVIGPNGAGKSTLLKILAGILPASGHLRSGRLLYLGKNLLELGGSERARRIAYVPSALTTDLPLTVEEVVSLGRLCWTGGGWKGLQARDIARVEWAIEKCSCQSLRDRPFAQLSGGERARVTLARALAQDARVLMLDETFSTLDLGQQSALGILLRELLGERIGIVLVSHDLNFASEISDRCLLLQAGRSVGFGASNKVLNEGTLKKLYPDARFSMLPNPKTGRLKVFISGFNG